MSGRDFFTTSFVLQVFLDCQQVSCQIVQYIQLDILKPFSTKITSDNSSRQFVPFYCTTVILYRATIKFYKKIVTFKNSARYAWASSKLHFLFSIIPIILRKLSITSIEPPPSGAKLRSSTSILDGPKLFSKSSGALSVLEHWGTHYQ